MNCLALLFSLTIFMIRPSFLRCYVTSKVGPSRCFRGPSALHSASGGGKETRSKKHVPRLYVSTPVTPSTGSVTLTASQSRHIKSVLRLKAGSQVTLFDGVSGEYKGALSNGGGKSLVKVDVQQKIRDMIERERRVSLVMCCINRSQIKVAASKSTELDASKITFAASDNSGGNNVRAAENMIESGKIYEVCKEASEQCGRLDVPEIRGDVGRLKDIVGELKVKSGGTEIDESENVDDDDDAKDVVGVCIERLESEVLSLVAFAADSKARDVTVIVGPEGGWSKDEIDFFNDCEWLKKVSLGSNVLRAETAAILAVGACSSAN